MYCEYCGRKINNYCNCLKSSNLKAWDFILFFVITFNLPIILAFIIMPNHSLKDANMLFIGSLTLSISLLILTILNVLLKRPYIAMFFSCHQRLERTLKHFKYPFFVCSRCEGIYIGIFLTSIFNYFFKIDLWVFIILALPLIIDGVLQYKFKIMSNNLRRFITGLFFAFPFSGLFSMIIYGHFYVIEWVVSLIK